MMADGASNALPAQDGFYNLDKPAGVSSMDALRHIKAARREAGLPRRRIGHAGTLDPLAGGVLPIAVGAATKTLSLIQAAEKTYYFTIVWGTATSTDDAEGDIVARSSKRPSRRALRTLGRRFCGVQEQMPPAFSALHVNGRRAYQLARAGEKPALAARRVEIFALDLLEGEQATNDTQAAWRVRCGKGTYVRALARDMAAALGTCGHVGALRRERVGAFTLDWAHDWTDFAPSSLPQLRPMEEVLPLPQVQLPPPLARAVRHGQAVPVTEQVTEQAAEQHAAAPMVLAMAEGAPLALGRLRKGRFVPQRLLS